MKNIQTIFKNINMSIKSLNIIKILTIWVNKLSKLLHITPKKVIILLGLLLTSLMVLCLGILGGNKEGFENDTTTSTDEDSSVADDDGSAADDDGSVADDDGGAAYSAYDDGSTADDDTTPKRIPPQLRKEELLEQERRKTWVEGHIEKYGRRDIDYEEKREIKIEETRERNRRNAWLERLFDKYEMSEAIRERKRERVREGWRRTLREIDGVMGVRNIEGPVHCVGTWSSIDNCENGRIRKKYNISLNASNGGDKCKYIQDEVRNIACVNEDDKTDKDDKTEDEHKIPESIKDPQFLISILNKIDSDPSNRNKWRKKYIYELKLHNEYVKYVKNHNKKYHSNNKVTDEYDDLTGSGIFHGGRDLYMLKSRMVPPTNPPGSNMNGNMEQQNNMNGNMEQQNNMNGNMEQQNNTMSKREQETCSSKNGCSKPAPVPPCPPCERCPEPAFDCKRVPNYSSVSSGKYLPRPVLSDFSQFGM